MTEQRIGIMGGTFDPIHIGHLVAAEEARLQFDLDRVIFMPSGHPAFKAADITSGEHRYFMTLLATASNPAFEASRFEIDRPGATYTVDTMRLLTEQNPGTRYFFITGADAVFEILKWRESGALAELCTLIAATRPGYDLEAAKRAHAHAVQNFSIAYMEVPALSVSSTDLRRRFAAGAAVRYLLPDAVISYIRQMGLYGTGDHLTSGGGH